MKTGIDKHKLSAIHARFRQLRNGEVADNLQAQGICYRLAWGLESYRLREISQEDCCQGNDEERKNLAEYLWQEDVRESKMLATRLYPIALMDREHADVWANDIKYTEIADQAAMNLFSRLPFATDLLHDWSQNAKPMLKYLALKIAARLDNVPEDISSWAEKIKNDETAPLWLRTAALWI